MGNIHQAMGGASMGHGYTGLAALSAILFCFSGAAAGYDYPIAGLDPSARPAGAPMILIYPKNADWYRHALTGIVPPYPASLRFLEYQGAWYTPFDRPGMTGPYDIRNWHAPSAGGASQAAERR
jgi:hypothetical protein